MKKPLHLFWQIPALTISLFICFAIGGLLSGLAEAPSASSTSPSSTDQAEAMAEAAGTAGMLLLSCFLTSLILALWLYFMQWRAWRAVLTVFIVYLTANTILTQIESLFFNSALKIPTSMIGKIIFSGLIISLLYAPISVAIMGRMRKAEESIVPFRLTTHLLKATFWIALIYVVIYFVFGYYVAWQSAAVREYYSGSPDILPFSTHMLNVLKGEPSLIVFQLFRGVIWAGLAILIAESTSVVWWIKAILTGLIFGVMLAGGLLLPNPFMPEAVRWAHLWETSSSNFLFGVLAIYLLHRLAWQKSSTLAQTD